MRNHATSEATNEDNEVFLYKMGMAVPKNVTRVRVDQSVENILPDTFRDCVDLVEVELGEDLQTIDRNAFNNCTSLLQIKIPYNVREIDHLAFSACKSLIYVELNEALTRIGGFTFCSCSSLPSIKIPARVNSIDMFAFIGCTSLTEIELSEALETLGFGVFLLCSSLYSIKIPSRVDAISKRAFSKCTSLKKVVLCEGVQTIDEEAFNECETLLGITIPSTINSIALDAFKDSTLLRNVAISTESKLTQEAFGQVFPTLSNMGVTLDMIKRRFDEMPLHRFCFDYQPIYNKQAGDNTSHADINHHVARLPAHGLQQDCLGMTPLHMLACSSRGNNMEFFQCMIEKYPNALLTKDLWGAIPLTYALYAEASIEVIHFLFKTHRQKWGNMPFDFGDMMLGLAGKIRASASVEYMRNVICAQRIHFPDLRVDWQEIMESDDMNGFDTDIGMYRVLIEASVSSRYICMSEEHRTTIDARVREIDDEITTIAEEGTDDDADAGTIIQYYFEIRDLVTNYARLHHEHLTEVTTILELALWKAAILLSSDYKQGLTRVECRTDAGRCAEIVIKHVLPFL
jgi:hypothetical protein